MVLRKSGLWGVLPKAFELLERLRAVCVAVLKVGVRTLDKIAIPTEPLWYIVCKSC